MNKNNIDFWKHYRNKEKTKHYLFGKVFSNKEWDDYVHDRMVQGIKISLGSPYRKTPDFCDRYHKIEGKSVRCINTPFYKSNNGGLYFCKSCAREIDKENKNADFTKLE